VGNDTRQNRERERKSGECSEEKGSSEFSSSSVFLTRDERDLFSFASRREEVGRLIKGTRMRG